MPKSDKMYIRLKEKIVKEIERNVKLKEIAEIEVKKDLKEELDEMFVYSVNLDKDSMHMVHIMDVIKRIKEKYEGMDIVSIGEDSTIIEYHKENIKENKFFEIAKMIVVCLTIFFGSAVAIMTFHTDVSMPEVHKQLYEIFMGVRIDKPLLIQIPYSIGIAVGIVSFFNHYGKKVEKYPTPLEIEISKYNADIAQTTEEKIRNNKNG